MVHGGRLLSKARLQACNGLCLVNKEKQKMPSCFHWLCTAYGFMLLASICTPAVCPNDPGPVPHAARLLGWLPGPLCGPHVRRRVERSQRTGRCTLRASVGRH